MLVPDTSAHRILTQPLGSIRTAVLDNDQERHYRVFTIEDHYLTEPKDKVSNLARWSRTMASDADAPQDAPTGVTAMAPEAGDHRGFMDRRLNDDGGQPITNYRYRYVIDDGDGQP